MQDTFKKIIEKVELLDKVHNGRKGTNAKFQSPLYRVKS